MEVEFETSEAHEELVDAVYEAFHDGVRVRPWEPHVSIAYENPDIAKVNLDFAIELYGAISDSDIANDSSNQGHVCLENRGQDGRLEMC